MIDELAAYLDYLDKVKHYSTNTIESYRSDIEKFITYIDNEHYSLKNVDSRVIRNFLMDETTSGISKRHVANNFSVIGNVKHKTRTSLITNHLRNFSQHLVAECN